MLPVKRSAFDKVHIPDEEFDRMYEEYDYHEGICPTCGLWHDLTGQKRVRHHMAYSYTTNRVQTCQGTGEVPYKTRSRKLYRLRSILRFE